MIQLHYTLEGILKYPLRDALKILSACLQTYPVSVAYKNGVVDTVTNNGDTKSNLSEITLVKIEDHRIPVFDPEMSLFFIGA